MELIITKWVEENGKPAPEPKRRPGEGEYHEYSSAEEFARITAGRQIEERNYRAIRPEPVNGGRALEG